MTTTPSSVSSGASTLRPATTSSSIAATEVSSPACAAPFISDSAASNTAWGDISKGLTLQRSPPPSGFTDEEMQQWREALIGHRLVNNGRSVNVSSPKARLWWIDQQLKVATYPEHICQRLEEWRKSCQRAIEEEATHGLPPPPPCKGDIETKELPEGYDLRIGSNEPFLERIGRCAAGDLLRKDRLIIVTDNLGIVEGVWCQEPTRHVPETPMPPRKTFLSDWRKLFRSLF